MLSAFIAICIVWGRTVWGMTVRPYETYRNLVDRANTWELVPLGFLISLYFAVASFVKTSVFRPYFLTKQFIKLGLGAAFGFIALVAVIWAVSYVFGGRSHIKRLLVGWGYTLVPTVMWFWATSMLYVVLPPPRTGSMAGISFSILYLVFSTTLLFWKLMLGFLTIRFVYKFSIYKITGVVLFVAPCVGVLSIVLYRLGIFRVPFL